MSDIYPIDWEKTKLYKEKSIVKFPNRFTYENFAFRRSNIDVILTCIIHGDVEQKIHRHLSSTYGCKYCAGNVKFTVEIFIERARSKHGNFYDYSKVVYVNNHTKIIIGCPKHGDFEQVPDSHLSGYGCPHCGHDKTAAANFKGTDKFILESNLLYKNFFDYTLVIYVSARDKVIIICPNHGEFKQSPDSHLHGHGCPRCFFDQLSDDKTLDPDEFIIRCEETHDYLYDYSLVDYKGLRYYITIICKKHGPFEQKAGVHGRGHGCSFCKNKTEGLVFDYLKTLDINFESQVRFPWCKKENSIMSMPFDFIIEEKKLIIEIDGIQHFEDKDNWYSKVEDNLRDDVLKMILAIQNGYTILRFIQNEIWKKKYDWKTVMKDAIENEYKTVDMFVFGKELSLYDNHRKKLNEPDISPKRSQRDIIFEENKEEIKMDKEEKIEKKEVKKKKKGDKNNINSLNCNINKPKVTIIFESDTEDEEEKKQN